MPYLSHTGPEGTPVVHPIVRRVTTIGASPECDIVLADVEVAPTHCTLIHEPGRYRLEAAKRSTPFYVAGKKLRAHDLRHGDVLRIGNTELVFSTLEEPAPAREGGQDTDALSLEAMRRLQRFSEMLAERTELAPLLEELIDQIVGLTRAQKGFLVLADPEAPSGYRICVARNLDRQPVDDPSDLLSDKIIRTVIDTRAPVISSDAYSDERFQESLSVINLKLSSVMCAPLLVRDELLGLIYVGNDRVRDLFRNEQLELLQVFAAQAALFVKNAQLLNELRSESADLAERLESMRFGEIIGACPRMVEIYRLVEKVAQTDITVLVTGETGTGKELIAREIHNRSPRADGPFVTVNCGAIPENLIESELFGHVRGAFTGAVADQKGKFQAADGGTLFLDEVGELPLQLQVKLLRALQEKTIVPVGSAKAIPVDIRIVAATNRDLGAAVREGTFREDLYFRLNVIGVHLPPLRERGDDVVLIARYLVGRYAREYGRDLDPATAFDPMAVEALRRFEWPGNIRQLENHVKKALVLMEGPHITARDLDLAPPEGLDEDGPRILPLAEARERWQRQYVDYVLRLNDGNRTKTARDLGVDPRTIFRYLERANK